MKVLVQQAHRRQVAVLPCHPLVEVADAAQDVRQRLALPDPPVCKIP